MAETGGNGAPSPSGIDSPEAPGNPQDDESGRQEGRIQHLVSELKIRTQALQEANQELERVDRYRSLFLSRMSHELRTPLTAILGFSEILLEHELLSDTQRRFCEKIQQSGLQLLASLNQLVDLSRIEAGKRELFLSEITIRELLRESCAAVAGLARRAEVEINCVTSPNLGSIVSDEGKLRHVVYNLISFAVRHSKQGATVSIRIFPRSPSLLCLEIDNALEVSEEPSNLLRMIDVGFDSPDGIDVNELGLSIAYRLITSLGGNVNAWLRRGEGLRMRVELPARPEEPGNQPPIRK